MQVTKRNKRLTYALIIAAIIAVMGLVGISVAGAQGGDGGGACHGTYYVSVANGQSYALWTFNQDGTFQGTDTAEPVFDFSHAQGAWQLTTARNAKATWLDFTYGDQPGAPGVASIEAELEFGDLCQTLDGTFVLGFYNYNQYPFDLANALVSFPGGSFTGQRVNP